MDFALDHPVYASYVGEAIAVSCCLQITKICSVLDMSDMYSYLSHQRILSQLETVMLDSTHTKHKRSACIKMAEVKPNSKHLVLRDWLI